MTITATAPPARTRCGQPENIVRPAKTAAGAAAAKVHHARPTTIDSGENRRKPQVEIVPYPTRAAKRPLPIFQRLREAPAPCPDDRQKASAVPTGATTKAAKAPRDTSSSAGQVT